jgi:hypothetical protein
MCAVYLSDPDMLFTRWYIQPLEKLKEIPNGDGAFVALTICCILYERYVVAVITRAGAKVTDEARQEQLTVDFETDKDTADAFWDIMRNGLAHEAMPKQKQHGKPMPGWRFTHNFPNPMELANENGTPILLVQPWRFMDKVLSLWRDNTHLLDLSSSFPWGSIRYE